MNIRWEFISNDQWEKMVKAGELLVEALGLGGDQHTKDTAVRFATALYELLYYHFHPEKEPEITVFEDPNYDELVIKKDIPFVSLCAHHLLPFEGVVHIAYLPDGKIIGLSKLSRIVDYFARRPQIQECLVRDIADYIMRKIEPKGVMVVAEGRHTCCACRGIQKEHKFITSAIRGCFKNLAIREEALSLIKL